MMSIPMSDGIAVVMAGATAVYLLVLMVSLVVGRKKPFIALRGWAALALMCFGGVVHVISATVAHQHLPFLVHLETMACPLWGYWLPYVFGVGIWFTAQYNQILTYSSVFRRITSDAQRRILNTRPFVSLALVIPPIFISIVVTAIPDVTRVDKDLGVCVSDPWAKYLIAGWLVCCLITLGISLVLFRRGVTSDPTGEWRRQWVLLVISACATGGQAFVVVFAANGLNSALNRFVATLIIVLLYVLTMSWVALRPVIWLVCGSRNKQRAEHQQLVEAQQSVESIRRVLENTAHEPTRQVRVIFADFMIWCSEMDSSVRLFCGNGCTVHPSRIVAFYQIIDFWTRTALGETYDFKKNPYGDRERGGYPPFFSKVPLQDACDIILEYFPRPYGEGPKPGTSPTQNDPREALGFPDDLMQEIKEQASHPDTPAPDMFRKLMWWCVDLLDDAYGKLYLQREFTSRRIALELDIRGALVMALRREAHERMQEAGIVVGDSDAEIRAATAGLRRLPSMRSQRQQLLARRGRDGTNDDNDDNDAVDDVEVVDLQSSSSSLSSPETDEEL